MSKCDDKQDEFLKNEYILNLDELIMTRNYVYKEKTYQKCVLHWPLLKGCLTT